MPHPDAEHGLQIQLATALRERDAANARADSAEGANTQLATLLRRSDAETLKAQEALAAARRECDAAQTECAEWQGRFEEEAAAARDLRAADRSAKRAYLGETAVRLNDARGLIGKAKIALDLIDVALSDKSMQPGARVAAAWSVAQEALKLFTPDVLPPALSAPAAAAGEEK